MIYIGIDPGFRGGVAAIGPAGEWIDGMRMPILHLLKREMIDTRELTRFYFNAREKAEAMPAEAIIEAVHAMPKQGVSSMFKFGRAAGAVEAWALATCSNKPHFVAPRTWKGAMGLTSDKRAALKMAEEKWGDRSAVKWNVLRNDGIAEAALLAEYHRTYWT